MKTHRFRLDFFFLFFTFEGEIDFLRPINSFFGAPKHFSVTNLTIEWKCHLFSYSRHVGSMFRLKFVVFLALIDRSFPQSSNEVEKMFVPRGQPFSFDCQIDQTVFFGQTIGDWSEIHEGSLNLKFEYFNNERLVRIRSEQSEPSQLGFYACRKSSWTNTAMNVIYQLIFAGSSKIFVASNRFEFDFSCRSSFVLLELYLSRSRRFLFSRRFVRSGAKCFYRCRSNGSRVLLLRFGQRFWNGRRWNRADRTKSTENRFRSEETGRWFDRRLFSSANASQEKYLRERSAKIHLSTFDQSTNSFETPSFSHDHRFEFRNFSSMKNKFSFRFVEFKKIRRFGSRKIFRKFRIFFRSKIEENRIFRKVKKKLFFDSKFFSFFRSEKIFAIVFGSIFGAGFVLMLIFVVTFCLKNQRQKKKSERTPKNRSRRKEKFRFEFDRCFSGFSFDELSTGQTGEQTSNYFQSSRGFA